MPKKQVLQGGGIIAYNDTVVLRRTKGGKWVFPKGHVEKDETTAQTAVREAEEETGLRVELAAPAPAGSVKYKEDGEKVTVEYYILRGLGPGPKWDAHHNADTFLVPAEQVAAHLSHGNLRRLWQEVQDEVLTLLASPRTL